MKGMIMMTYPYKLPPLPYGYSDLEPYIDAETMHYHHDKHFKTYVDNLNKALENCPGLQKLTLKELLSRPYMNSAILRNGGGVYNHNMFFNGLVPASQARKPQGKLLCLIEKTYGSFDQFKEAFNKEAMDVFGSGWAVLAINCGGCLKIAELKNQDTLLGTGLTPLVYVDVWEHAYYLKYKNLRAEYLKNIWNVIDFPVI